MVDAVPEKFSSTEEEICFWRRRAETCQKGWEGAREELEEFQESSRELEAELEAQLVGAESRTRELASTNTRMLSELEALREKSEKQHAASHRQVSELEVRLGKALVHTEQLQKYVRQLEQTNDDLERAKRAAMVSLEDFETHLNQAIERNAFLESELGEKENLVVCVQRLKDEARDLRQEMVVHDVKGLGVGGAGEAGGVEEAMTVTVKTEVPETPGDYSQLANQIQQNESRSEVVVKSTNELGDASARVKVEAARPPPLSTPLKSYHGAPPLLPSIGGITPASRISALNIVGDLLRKVGAIESRMLACRNLSFDAVGTHHATERHGGGEPSTTGHSTASRHNGVKHASMGDTQPAGVDGRNYIQITV